MMSGRNQLTKAEAVLIAMIERALPSLAKARELVERFQSMIRNGNDDDLDGWIDHACQRRRKIGPAWRRKTGPVTRLEAPAGYRHLGRYAPVRPTGPRHPWTRPAQGARGGAEAISGVPTLRTAPVPARC